MESLIKEFISRVGAGEIWYGFLVLAVYYIIKKEPFKVFTHFSEKKDRDISQAKELLESDKLSKEANDLIKEYLERESFKKYYGIYAGRDMRTALLKFYNKHQQVIGWHELKRAFPHLYIDGSKIRVRLTIWDHANRWFTTGLSIFIALYALIFLCLAIIFKHQNPSELAKFFLLTTMSVLLLGSAVSFSTLNWSFHSAKKISKIEL